MEKKYRKNEIFKELLRHLSTASGIAALALNKGELYRLMHSYDYGDKEKVRQTLRRLKRNKFIKTYEHKGEELVEISALGLKKILKYNYDDFEMPKPKKKWDRKWRIVVFDIPEKKKKVRDSVSLKLKELGFGILQKSTFIYPYECRREIEFIKNHFFLRDELSYILADEIDRGEYFEEKFNL